MDSFNSAFRTLILCIICGAVVGMSLNVKQISENLNKIVMHEEASFPVKGDSNG